MFLALLAATLAAPVPKAKAVPLYFSTAVGATWVYERDGGDEAVEKNGDDLVVSRTNADKRGTKYATVVVSADGMRQPRELADGKVGWVVKVTVRDGDSWEVPGGGKWTVHGPEQVEVPVGKFQAVSVMYISRPVRPHPLSPDRVRLGECDPPFSNPAHFWPLLAALC